MFATHLARYLLHSLLKFDLFIYVHFHNEIKEVLTIRVQILMRTIYFWKRLARLRIENPGYVISISNGVPYISLTDAGSKINYTLKFYSLKNHNKKFLFNENEVQVNRIKYKGKYTCVFNFSNTLDHIYNRHSDYPYFFFLS